MFSRRRIIILILGFIFNFGILIPRVSFALERDLSIQLSGVFGQSVTGLPQYIEMIYNYAIGLAVSLAIFMVMVGGFYWITAAGDKGKIGKATNLITDAIIGLILTLGAYIILNTINPALLSLKMPTVTPIKKEPWSAIGQLVNTSCAKNELAGDGVLGHGCKQDGSCNTGLYCVETDTIIDIGVMDACAASGQKIGSLIGKFGGAIGGTTLAGPVGTVAGSIAAGKVVGFVGKIAGQWVGIFKGKNKLRYCTDGKSGSLCGEVKWPSSLETGIPKEEYINRLVMEKNTGCVAENACSCLKTCAQKISREIGEPCSDGKECELGICDTKGFFGSCGVCRGQKTVNQPCNTHYDCLKGLTCFKPPQAEKAQSVQDWVGVGGFCVKAEDKTGYGVYRPVAYSDEKGGSPCFVDGDCESETQKCMQCRQYKNNSWVTKDDKNIKGSCIDCSLGHKCQGGLVQGCNGEVASLCLNDSDCKDFQVDACAPVTKDCVKCQLPPLKIQQWLSDTLKIKGVVGICGYEPGFTLTNEPCYTTADCTDGQRNKDQKCQRFDGSSWVDWNVETEFEAKRLGPVKVFEGRCAK